MTEQKTPSPPPCACPRCGARRPRGHLCPVSLEDVARLTPSPEETLRLLHKHEERRARKEKGAARFPHTPCAHLSSEWARKEEQAHRDVELWRRRFPEGTIVIARETRRDGVMIYGPFVVESIGLWSRLGRRPLYPVVFARNRVTPVAHPSTLVRQ